MTLLFICLAIVIFLQLLVLFKIITINRGNEIQQLSGKIDLLPELLKDKMTIALLDNKQQLLTTLNELIMVVKQQFNTLQLTIVQQLGSNNEQMMLKFNQFNRDLQASMVTLGEKLQQELERINLKVEERLKEGFAKTTETFTNILERLSKIDEAQKKIEQLSGQIVSLQDVLGDKKSRGIFGEVQLKQILSAVFGDNNHKLYATQYQLSNGTITDAIIFTPQPLGNIAVDAKFPLENYRKMLDINLSIEARELAKREFENNIKKHIDDIASKYIIAGETSHQAVMFIPAEAIFAEINAYHHKLLDYAQKRQVWLASPTTLMATLTTIQVILNNMEQAKYATIIQENLLALSEEFSRYRIRWDSLAKHIDTVSKDVHDIHTTTTKIGNKFLSIAKVECLDTQ